MTHSVPEIESTPTYELASEIKAWMARLGFRQVDIANALGLAQTQISARLRGQRPFTFEQLVTISSTMGITLGELLGHELLNKEHLPPAVQEEGGLCSPPDSNRRPTDQESGALPIELGEAIASGQRSKTSSNKYLGTKSK